MQLLIMAAGMGSRFGGLKQIASMGPNDEFIIDYSIYDAIKAGFSKVVFIIKKENYEIFKETIGKRVESHIPVEYVFQELEDVPSFVKIPEDRVKPWGTGHAIYAARKAITEPFLVINSDDFYGRDAYTTAKEFLKKAKDHEYATIAYKVTNTMTENGSVKRGVIKMDNDGRLDSLVESSIERVEDKIIAKPLNDSEPFEVTDKTLVSMNLLTFDLSIFAYLEEKMNEFFKENEGNLDKCEFLIPEVMTEANKEGFAKVLVIPTKAVWHGVTYKEDTDSVRSAIKELVLNGEYPNDLWR